MHRLLSSLFLQLRVVVQPGTTALPWFFVSASHLLDSEHRHSEFYWSYAAEAAQAQQILQTITHSTNMPLEIDSNTVYIDWHERTTPTIHSG